MEATQAAVTPINEKSAEPEVLTATALSGCSLSLSPVWQTVGCLCWGYMAMAMSAMATTAMTQKVLKISWPSWRYLWRDRRIIGRQIRGGAVQVLLRPRGVRQRPRQRKEIHAAAVYGSLASRSCGAGGPGAAAWAEVCVVAVWPRCLRRQASDFSFYRAA